MQNFAYIMDTAFAKKVVLRERKREELDMKKWYRGGMAALCGLLLSLTTFAAGPETLIPGGSTIGIRMETAGVSIVEITDAAPEAAGLEKGDLIIRVDDQPVQSAEELKELVSHSNGTALKLLVLHQGKERSCTIAPKQSPRGWCLGLLVKDSICGIGTVTYYNAEDGSFGALGHGVGSRNELLPLREGEILPSGVKKIIPGQEGTPGCLQGEILSEQSRGKILRNTARGIFGIAQDIRGTALPVAHWKEIHRGEAVIFSTVQGTEIEEFTVEIQEIRPGDEKDRNFVLKVTDPELLALTGGIVQGMSGSPIIQDGKLIGAVTHVLVDDPTTGYGIFIENMLDAAA